MMTMFAGMMLVVGCERNSSPASSAGTVSVDQLRLLDLGAKMNVPTKDILDEIETRGLRSATDSEVRAWIAAGNRFPEKVIVIAEVDNPKIVGVLKRKMSPGFVFDTKNGKVVELSIRVPEGGDGWATASYRFATMPKK